MNFLNNTEDLYRVMNILGIKTIDELFPNFPTSNFNLPKPLEEWEVEDEFFKKFDRDFLSLIGAGVYEHFIPAEVWYIAKRSEFLTAYTPYQPEASQGTLEVVFKFQSIISNLTGFDVTNAGLWDVPTAVVEAIILGSRVKNTKKVLMPSTTNPFYRRVIKTHLPDFEFIETSIDLESGKSKLLDAPIVLIQNPNFFGVIEDKAEFDALNAFKIYISDDPNFLIMLKPFAADVFIGNSQPLGNPVAFGAEHAAIFSTKLEYLRLIPGRIVAQTFDTDGKIAYTLTLQTREQHIRKEKATSNICTNNQLNIIASTIYLMLLGRKGIEKIVNRCIYNLNLFKEKFKPVFSADSLYECVFSFDHKRYIDLKNEGIYAGLELGKIYPELDGCYLVYVPDTVSLDTVYGVINRLR
ncbi:MAG: hypothetical protein NZ870_01605 [bacterium]|nr:hypothetical protein [bacterium]